MKQFFWMMTVVALSGAVRGESLPGVPRDSNFNNTGGYDSTRVEARLIVPIQEQTKVVHFIRDNNDPRVVTKTYLLKNVDAYEFRDYVRQMVQAKRVGNTSLQQVYPGNNAPVTSTPSNSNLPNQLVQPTSGTTSYASPVTPATAQPTYSPNLQLGSNTAVECLKYVDGTGLLLISAEEYRFRDHPNGMGFDSLVKFLDKPQMGAFFGTQTYFYIPKYVPSRNLLPMIQNVGMNVMDVSEVWQGMDLVAYDPDLNWLVFDVVNFSMFNIDKMLKLYDVPIPQVRLKITVYEIFHENDEKIGLDFQAWKNNDGMDFFSAGGRYRDNWSALFTGGLGSSGTESTSYYNFNPKWNSRYIDFLTSIGKAEVAHTGTLLIRNNTPASLSCQNQIFYFDTTTPAPNTQTTPDFGVGPYKLLSNIIDVAIASSDAYPVSKANQQLVTGFAGFGFTMNVTNASVNIKETRFDVTLSNSSLIGFESSGKPRISNGNSVSLSVSLPHGKNSFVIGGLKKQETVKSSTGVPWVKDLPYIGYLFSTKSTSIKNSELVVVGECELASPPLNLAAEARKNNPYFP
ncbi:MAG: hypothetical protein PHS41_10145 [Victivallaceae bacterium]|nr:hypothetical protein [Victivallaceae bacterium]